MEVRDGILCHTGKKKADTMEGRIVHYADRIAYLNHDIDDAIRGDILSPQDIPASLRSVLGQTHSQRIDTLVNGLLTCGEEEGEIGLPPLLEEAMLEMRDFMFRHVYQNPRAKGEERKGQWVLTQLYRHFSENADDLPTDYMQIALQEGAERAACDYVAGMTDRFAVDVFARLYIPQSWNK